MSTVVSVRIKKEVKEILEKAGVNLSELVRVYLEEVARGIKLRENLRELDLLLERVRPSEKGFAARSVREDRESR